MVDKLGTLALDPGVTTGWAYLVDGRVKGCGQLEQSDKLSRVFHLLTTFEPEVIVCETFTYQRRDKVDLTPKMVEGVIRLWAELEGAALFMQTPAMAKKFFSDNKLKALGLWRTNQRHAMDAMRHLMYYLVVTKGERQWLEPLRPEM